MIKQEAAKILRDHNIWRRGADTPMTGPKLLGEALETAIRELGSPTPSQLDN